jgi:HlyD family secretion protein
MKKVGTRRIVIWGAVALIVAALLAVALVPRPVQVEVAEVSRGPLEVTLDHEGKTRVKERYTVSAPVAGQVLRIELEPGDPVVAGKTVLATFLPADPTPLDARTRAEAQARAKAAQASLDSAVAQERRARAEADLAATERDRARHLRAVGVVTQQALDEAEAQARAAHDALAAATAAAATARHDVAAARAALLSVRAASEGGPGDVLLLRSPVTGVVLRRLRESRAVVPAGEPLVEVADRADLEIVADYLSSDAVQIKPGMPVHIDQWGGGATLAGAVQRVEPSGFMKVSALGVEEQRVWVVVEFADPYRAWESLGDGYRVETRAVVWRGEDVLRLPTSALFRHGERWAVFVLHAGRARLTEVSIGHRSALQAEVTAGVELGDRVVVHPSDAVVNGVRVRPQKG